MNKRKREELDRLRTETIAQTKAATEQMRSVMSQYLTTLEQSGNFKDRQKIALSNQELTDYLIKSRANTLLIAADYAILWAFIGAKGLNAEYQDFHDSVAGKIGPINGSSHPA